MGFIRLKEGRFGWDCLLEEVETGKTLLIQSDRDYPGVATAFGWRPCHPATDGTIDCPVCGRPASESIREAREFLDAHIGEEVEDPGYFG